MSFFSSNTRLASWLLPAPVGPISSIGAFERVATVSIRSIIRLNAGLRVAMPLLSEARAYLKSSACVSEHLSDQLLLPMALAGGSAFTTHAISDHLRSNARLIEKFLAVEIEWTEQRGDAWRVTVAS